MAIEGNHTPLTPASFLRRSARVFPAKTAIVDGARRISYRQFHERACRQANGLLALGIGTEDRVALLAPNTAMHLEANFGVPMAGGTLVAINTRLSPREIAYILNHSGARVLLADAALLAHLEPVAAELTGVERVIVEHGAANGPGNGHGAASGWEPAGALDYEAFLAGAAGADPMILPADESQTISINYTSGTTGNPKGVMYTHRSVYLNGVCNLLEMGMTAESVYLWTLPMFHCNGWCYTWGVTALGGTHVCLRDVKARAIVEAIVAQGVTHFCGAPIVLRMVVEGAQELGLARFPRRVKVSTAAAPPSPTVIEAMLGLGVDVLHVYGLTETYGPTTVCEIQPDWLRRPPAELARLMARQGVPYALCEDLTVLDDAGRPVAADGKTLGEVCMRGNIVMKGYFRNPEATEQAMRGGWFHSGDLGVLHPDGYIELKDRAKDIIISGGENISTIEVENVLYTHPAVQDTAVVSRPDAKWGEVPVAFVTLRQGAAVAEQELIAYCRQHLAHFKAPKAILFEELPRTSTGKVQKFVLRDRLWAGRAARIQG
ncbi:MAG: long-chain-fatty-acid--CoA ligase [Candidatus Lambdaproteobacteria bacterium]|nr:long-chain-fatty-acid--CoA ligase [Candidatus Lambdaproteobacteria bacterium]